MCCSGVVVLLQWRGLRTEALGAHHTGFANTEKTMLVDPELELMCKRKVVWWKRHELAEDVLKKSKRLPICMCQCKPKEWLVLTRVWCKKEVLFCCCFVYALFLCGSKQKLACASNIFPLGSTTKKNVKGTNPTLLLHEKKYKRCCCPYHVSCK